ncbi:MAG TPA: hypothetical protein VMR45_02740 [Patescibacteria group bacterium]|nr:hypothetical protein [Patescibacteria group bacterium]
MILRLFAGAGRPVVDLWSRLLLFVCGLALLAALAIKFTPPIALGYTTLNLLSLQFLLGVVFVALLFLLSDGYQRTFMVKLNIIYFYPISRKQIIWLSLLAYAPMVMLVYSIVLPVIIKTFYGQQPLAALLISSTACCTLAIACNIFLRIFDSKLSVSPQATRLAMIAAATLMAWRINERPGRIWLVPVSGLAIILAAMLIYLAHRPVVASYKLSRIPVRPFNNLNIMNELYARALRNGRYLGANCVLIIAVIGLSLLSWRMPSVLPFDAVCVVVLLLVGTLGQEARALSRRFYPIELVRYGLVRKWLVASWALVFANALLVVIICLVVASLWFPDGLSVGYGRVVGLGLSLTAVAVLAGSLVVPQKQDILAQFASTALYAVFAWCTMRFISDHAGYGLVTVSIIFVCLALSYVIEKVRWTTTISTRLRIKRIVE